MKKAVVALGLALALAACAETPPPRITEISESALRIEATEDHGKDEINRKAHEGCRIYDRRAKRVEETCLNDSCSRKSYLFACK